LSQLAGNGGARRLPGCGRIQLTFPLGLIAASTACGTQAYSTGSQEWSGSKRVIGNGALPGTGAISF
jgi:hypothetical protein